MRSEFIFSVFVLTTCFASLCSKAVAFRISIGQVDLVNESSKLGSFHIANTIDNSSL